MHKFFKLTLTATIILALTTGCTQNKLETTAGEPAIPKDGTYQAAGQPDPMGWTPEISITISNGKITEVKYDEVAPMRKSENIEYQNSFKIQNKLELLTIYTDLQNNLLKSQDPAKLDNITGATKASESFKKLAEEALKSAMVENKLKDGAYSVLGEKDEKSWVPKIYLTIKDGKITTVRYDEISTKVFKYKSQDNTYIAKYKEKSKLDLIAVYDLMQKSLIEKQDPAKTDAIAGATQAHKSFVELAAKTLQEAIK